MEKNILSDIYEDEQYDSDLNKAKLSLNNDNSTVIQNNNQDNFNLTTPVYYRNSGSCALEYEDLIFKNHNQAHNFSSSSSSLNNHNNYNIHNNHFLPVAKTYMEEKPPDYNDNYGKIYTNVTPLSTRVNYTSDTHTLSLSEVSTHSFSSVKGVTFSPGNSCLMNTCNNITTTNFNLNNVNNNFINYNENKFFNKSNYYYTTNTYNTNSFNLDQGHNLPKNNPNNYTFSGI